MKRAALYVTLIATTGIACNGHPKTAPSNDTATHIASGADPWKQEPAKKDPLRHPLLWAIEKDGRTTFAFGTMHTGVDPDTRLPEIVWAKLHEARSFAMETDLSEAGLADQVRRTDGGTLHKDLGDEDWNKLEGALTPAVAKGVDKMKPMIAATMLSLHGLPTTAPMDMALSGRALGEHKPMVYLEPAAKQMALLDKWMDVRALKVMLDELADADAHAKDMLDAYVAGDEAKLVAISDTERADALKHGYTAAEYDQEMNELLYDRNRSWIDAIEKLHTDGGGFIAVGAMHLCGPHSVLELLAKDGYKVTRLTP